MTKNQLTELKELLYQTKDQISDLQNQITSNHKELLEKISRAEETSNEALRIAQKNESEIFNIKEQQDNIKAQQDVMETNIKSEVLETLKNDIGHLEVIKKLEHQLKGAMIEMEDLRNRSMRSTLIFKNIPEEEHETWEDTCATLAEFITTELTLPYSFDEIDMLISRAHRGPENNEEYNQNHRDKSKPKPIFAQFSSWRVAEEVRNAIIHQNYNKKTNVSVNQMFSKQLTARRNEALKFRREYLNNHQDKQVKLDYPATLKSRVKGSRSKWDILRSF